MIQVHSSIFKMRFTSIYWSLCLIWHSYATFNDQQCDGLDERILLSTQLPFELTIEHCHFRVDRVLGQGCYGIVYLATDTGDCTRSGLSNTPFIIKDQQNSETARRELVSLEHAGRFTVSRIDEHRDALVVAQLYVSGQTFQQAVTDRDDLSFDEKQRAKWRLVESLRQFHKDTGLAHLDATPKNAIMKSTGQDVGGDDVDMTWVDLGNAQKLPKTNENTRRWMMEYDLWHARHHALVPEVEADATFSSAATKQYKKLDLDTGSVITVQERDFEILRPLYDGNPARSFYVALSDGKEYFIKDQPETNSALTELNNIEHAKIELYASLDPTRSALTLVTPFIHGDRVSEIVQPETFTDLRNKYLESLTKFHERTGLMHGSAVPEKAIMKPDGEIEWVGLKHAKPLQFKHSRRSSMTQGELRQGARQMNAIIQQRH